MARNYEHKKREYTKVPVECLSMFKLISHEMGGLIMDLLDDYNQALLNDIDAPLPSGEDLDKSGKFVLERMCGIMYDDAVAYEEKCKQNKDNRAGKSIYKGDDEKPG